MEQLELANLLVFHEASVNRKLPVQKKEKSPSEDNK
jgi:hypothetical protein